MGEPEKQSHDTIQRLVDQAASFNLFVMPDSRAPVSVLRSPGQSTGSFGIEGAETIHRFDIDLDLPTSKAGVRAANRVSRPAGRVEFRCLIVPHDFTAMPDREPPPTPLDATRSQRFVMQSVAFKFGSGRDGFRAFGAGRTFPMMVRGKPQIAAAAVGIFTSGFGQLQGCEGNFTLCGQVSESEGFTGHIMCRILDFNGRLRTAGLPPLEDGMDPDPSSTFLTWIAQKGQGPDQENTASMTPEGTIRGLNIPVQLKRVRVGFEPADQTGLRCLDLETFEVIGREIGFGKESVPRTPVSGTPQTPFQFEGVSRYSFYDPDGRTVGAFTANVLEGRSMQVRLPGAPDQPALRFGYFGPIIQGFGCFRGAQGFLYGAAGSVFAPPPFDHVISNMYVARICDPEGRFRTAAVSRQPAAPPASNGAASEPPQRQVFKGMVKKLDEYTETYKRWRIGMRECSRQVSHAVASKYNSLLSAGDFPGLPMDAESLKNILEAEIGPFDAETFERYGGRAKGTFKIYNVHTLRQEASSVLYSYWDRKTLMDGERHYKQITGSDSGYYEPDRIPPVSENKVDLLTNSYRRDVGVCSYIRIYQHRPQERTSFAYKMPHPHEVLWFVKDLSIDNKPVHDSILMASHEWKGIRNGRTYYFMVGIFFDINFSTCEVKVAGDQFWRALYEEDSTQSL